MLVPLSDSSGTCDCKLPIGPVFFLTWRWSRCSLGRRYLQEDVVRASQKVPTTPWPSSHDAACSQLRNRKSVPKFHQERSQDTRLTVTQASGSASGGPAVFHFHYQLSEQHSACWDGILRGERLFIQIPPGLLAEGSKEGLTALLEFTEEKLKVNFVFLWFHKSRADRLAIIRTFHYMGFEMVKPGDPVVPACPDLIFMAYPLEASSSDEE
ncbi:unnamed protein product [Lota lota]